MIKIKEAVVVEGKYDKIKVKSILDAPVITTDGFGIFKNKEKQRLLRKLAEERGILILTDSDSAGFLIRSFIKGCVPKGKIKHAYIPDLFGREKRKTSPSAEGKLGVEGVPAGVIEESLRKAGVVFSREDFRKKDEVKKTDLYSDGFYGSGNCNERRKKLIKKLDLPENISVNALIEMINVFTDREGYEELVKEIDRDENRSRL